MLTVPGNGTYVVPVTEQTADDRRALHARGAVDGDVERIGVVHRVSF